MVYVPIVSIVFHFSKINIRRDTDTSINTLNIQKTTPSSLHLIQTLYARYVVNIIYSSVKYHVDTYIR